MAPLDEGLFRMFFHVGDIIVKHDHQQQFWSWKITQDISKCISMLIATQLHEPNRNGIITLKALHWYQFTCYSIILMVTQDHQALHIQHYAQQYCYSSHNTKKHNHCPTQIISTQKWM